MEEANGIKARSTLGSQMTCHPTAAGLGVGMFSYNHYLPACVMSNQVAPGREHRHINATDVHRLGGRDFCWTAPSQIRFAFARVVQMHDR